MIPPPRKGEKAKKYRRSSLDFRVFSGSLQRKGVKSGNFIEIHRFLIKPSCHLRFVQVLYKKFIALFICMILLLMRNAKTHRSYKTYKSQRFTAKYEANSCIKHCCHLRFIQVLYGVSLRSIYVILLFVRAMQRPIDLIRQKAYSQEVSSLPPNMKQI